MYEGRYRIFEKIGVEIEYMIVDARTLSVAPIADRILIDESGAPESEIEVGPLAWSNELVLHVLEIKTNGPADTLHGLASSFQESIARANSQLARHGAMLLPTGMHPWMDPVRETRLWPHEHSAVYQTFDRVFGCTGHGWSNLQSMHINLSFSDDDEFRRLHAAIRFALPLLPALAASSPFKEGAREAWLDTRLETYRHNAARVPSVSGMVVPEPANSEAEYQDTILARIYADLARHDPDGVLKEEWVNARGAIARFDRGTVEIRVLDTQECAVADHAIAAATTAMVGALANETTASSANLNALPTERLAAILRNVMVSGESTPIEDREYLRALGWTRGACRARDVWEQVVVGGIEDGPDRPAFERAIEVIMSEGCLARRILEHSGVAPDKLAIQKTYSALAECLAAGTQLRTAGAPPS